MKNTKAILISDTHAALRLPMAHVDEGGVSSDRLRDVTKVLRQAVDVAAEEECPLIILGDLFDQQRPSGAALVAVSSVLRYAIDNGVEVFILPGNHDAIGRDGRLYNLHLFNELKLPGVHVFKQKDVVEVTEGIRLHAVPWLPEGAAKRRIRKRARDCDPNGLDYLLVHQTIAGAVGDSGWVSDDGIEPGTMDRFTYALSGHYHLPQRHGSWGMYLGSPLMLNFAEAAEDQRGFWLIDWAKPMTTSNPKLIVPDFPILASETIDLEKGDRLDHLFDLTDFCSTGVDYARLVLQGDREAIIDARTVVSEWRSKLDTFGLRHIKVDERPNRVAQARLKMKGAAFTLDEAVSAYAHQYGDEGEASALASVGAALLSAARSE